MSLAVFNDSIICCVSRVNWPLNSFQSDGNSPDTPVPFGNVDPTLSLAPQRDARLLSLCNHVFAEAKPDRTLAFLAITSGYREANACITGMSEAAPFSR
jgi:hypothetical protein